MSRLILVLSVVLLMSVVGVQASDLAREIPAGTSDVTIDFDWVMPCLAIRAWDSRVTAVFYLEDGTTDTLFVLPGYPVSPCIPCDSLKLDRTGSTAVTVLLAARNGDCPEFAGADTDSLLIMATQPGVRRVSGTTVLMQNRDFTPADAVTAENGVTVDGAFGVILDCSVSGFKGGFRITHMFFSTDADTTGMTAPYDTTGVDSATCSLTGARHFTVFVPMPVGMQYGLGTYRPRVTMWGTAGAANDLENLTIGAKVGY